MGTKAVAPSWRPLWPQKYLEQFSHRTLLHERVPQRQLWLDLVAVPAAISLPQDIPLLDQLGEDLVGAPLGDADRGGDVAQANTRIIDHAQEHVSVGGVRKSQRGIDASKS
jgi:hypothetical protein